MESFVIEGGVRLSGTVRVHGAKNAALPILAATLLADGLFVLENVPDLLDIRSMEEILMALGVRVKREGEMLVVDARGLRSNVVPEALMSRMRSSIFLMGPLLARTGEAVLGYPGGCAIGTRPIDLHLEGLKKLGAVIHEYGGTILARAPRLEGTTIVLDYPSVGATENLMMAAALARGTTRIVNAAREPEIQELERFLNAMGARIRGAGTHAIVIEGVERLHPPRPHRVIPDRIVAGTLLAAAAITEGRIVLEDVIPEHLEAVIDAFRKTGARIEVAPDRIAVEGVRPYRAIHRLSTSPHPGFPTDMQPQLLAYLTQAEGTSVLVETVFDGRFRHVPELVKMGADIVVDYHTAVIRGPRRLVGARVRATDLRAGAALVLAGLAAEGVTIVEGAVHIDRGYHRLEETFAALGARIVRTTERPLLAPEGQV
ncbi:UDP-N-acetylglucosamine 1-carboxyvinyltransferase [Hydrogenibacillus schlegelii]|uniref:UDP-N-acetylglucosamine 1-carboxyvinyltransferase n=1 Tax=Hydrogenibacillus schlegelii TaxID=1484 RepID=A0A132NA87_HYDSH|nr:UDP-N-acetylglucosamine 1-carboxyvinyltransferase [Hydrogenibacillus schlegelii]KWX07013.1 UDP-N-acetylglucosamine 1-carboxyvinyltransferase [Hydrogenibacillus schlegelii]OAR03877.1 UDP-N-acetylglucosamine 1-carboxyvinyltransferase [Hydrogenibacillus schlegelii]